MVTRPLPFSPVSKALLKDSVLPKTGGMIGSPKLLGYAEQVIKIFLIKWESNALSLALFWRTYFYCTYLANAYVVLT